MPTANEHFLKTVAASGLLPAQVIDALRQKIATAKDDVEPRHLAKYLVGKGHLSSYLAEQLLARDAELRSKAPAGGQQESDELRLAEDELQVVEAPPRPAAPQHDELEVVDEPRPAARGKGDDGAWSRPVSEKRRKSSRQKRQAPPQPQGAFQNSVEPALDLLQNGVPTGMPLGGGPMGGSLRARRSVKRKQGTGWDRPLLMWCLFGLMLGGVLSGLLAWSILRSSGDEMLKEAEAAYNVGSYTEAIERFEAFLEKFPDHPQASVARVHRTMAELRQYVDSTNDWTKALAAAEELLPTIEGEEGFGKGRTDLTAILPKIAKGIADQARAKPTQELIDLAHQAVELCNNSVYIPKAERQTETLEAVKEALVVTQRILDRQNALDKAVAAIAVAVAAGNTAEAYLVREELLRLFPDLLTNDLLAQSVRAATQAQQSQAKWVGERRPAETTEAPSAVVVSVPLATRTPGQATGVDGQVIYALSEGAAYGLDAATGRVLWHRFVGFDAEQPPASIDSTADALLVDAERQELVRVAAATGELRWRQPLGAAPAGAPLVLRDRILVSLRPGQLATIDLNSGEWQGAYQIPQTLRTGPAADVRERRYYQVADDSSLYVFSAKTQTCQEVAYLGHSSGSVTTPPVIMSRFVIVAENTGLRAANLRVLETDEEGEQPAQEVLRLPLDGHVRTSPVVAGKNLLLATDLGGLYSFEATTNPDQPFLREIASLAAAKRQAAARFVTAQGAQFWVADTALTKYDVQVAQGRFASRWLQYDRDTFVQPLQMAGELLFAARRRNGMPGVAVAAVRASDGSPVWETHLGAPLAGEFALDPASGGATALTTVGGAFRVTPAELAGENCPDAVAAVALASPLSSDTSATSFPQGRWTFTSPAMGPRFLLFDPPTAALRWQDLPTAASAASAPFADALLIPGETGYVLLVDPTTGAAAAEPYLPTLEVGTAPRWRGPVATEHGAIVSDGDVRLFLLGVVAQPQPHLSPRTEADLDRPLATSFAVLSDGVYAVDETNRLLRWSLPDLGQTEVLSLPGEPAWGPRRVGDWILTATGDALFCCDGERLVWQAPLAHGPLAGATLTAGGELLCSSARGAIWTVDRESGREKATVELGQPLAAGLAAIGDRIVAAGHDGTLHVVAIEALTEARGP